MVSGDAGADGTGKDDDAQEAAVELLATGIWFRKRWRRAGGSDRVSVQR